MSWIQFVAVTASVFAVIQIIVLKFAKKKLLRYLPLILSALLAAGTLIWCIYAAMYASSMVDGIVSLAAAILSTSCLLATGGVCLLYALYRQIRKLKKPL